MASVYSNNGDVSIISAYKNGDTYSQVTDLLKGVIKQDQKVIRNPSISYSGSIKGGGGPDHSSFSNQNSPYTVSVKAPKIDYTGIQLRQVEFERRKNEWNVKIRRQETQLVKLKQINFDLIGKLKQINLQIDELIQQAQVKNQIDAMREHDQGIVEQYECDHQQMIERLEELIQRKETAIYQMQDRLESQITLKEREISNANDKLKTARIELKSMKKKSKMTEADKLIAMQEKIAYTIEQNKELEKELRLLKRQQHLQGSELHRLENTETYQQKVKQLMEELRFAREKQMDQSEKLGTEQASIARQKERIEVLEYQLEPYEGMDIHGEVRDIQMQNQLELDQNSELIQRIIELEQDQAAKQQENRLLMLKFKNTGAASQKGLPPKRFDLATIDKAIYQTEERRPSKKQGSITGRSHSSIGKLEPIHKGIGKQSTTTRVMATIEPSRSKSNLNKIQSKNLRSQRNSSVTNRSGNESGLRIRSRSNLRAVRPGSNLQAPTQFDQNVGGSDMLGMLDIPTTDSLLKRIPVKK